MHVEGRAAPSRGAQRAATRQAHLGCSRGDGCPGGGRTPQGGPRKGQSKGAPAHRLGPRPGGEATAGGVKAGRWPCPPPRGAHSPCTVPTWPRGSPGLCSRPRWALTARRGAAELHESCVHVSSGPRAGGFSEPRIEGEQGLRTGRGGASTPVDPQLEGGGGARVEEEI